MMPILRTATEAMLNPYGVRLAPRLRKVVIRIRFRSGKSRRVLDTP